MASDGRVRFSIDTGGTFTDIVVLDEETGTFRTDKVATTPENTLLGVLHAIDKARIDLGRVGRFFVHGSTSALNALLERKGVKTAYVTTEGFRDVPEIGRYNRPEMYNPKYHRPPQIVPRDLRFEVRERVHARGNVLVELDEESVRKIVPALRKREVRAVAVCLLHGFKNPVHERRVREIIQEELPDVSVSISSEVVSEHREYERSMTTILNAYLAPIVETWIARLEDELRGRGFRGEVVLTRSDGGGMTGETAKRSPINTLLSGPAGGVIGGLFLAEATGQPNLLTADMGGTSFDVCMIKDGQASTAQETSVSGYPMLIPNLDIRTIGAGGGSISWIDAAGALHVGPQSSGAEPGPICYGRGGTEPTVTDAALAAGLIDPHYFLGGEMSLDVERARAAIRRKVSEPLRLDPDAAASGILRLALSNMTEAVKDICSEKGDDPRDFALLCYGGGGPLFAAFLMDELEVRAAVVPIAPANFSAWGMLMVDLRHDLVMTVMKRLNALTAAELHEQYDALAARGAEILEKEGVAGKDRKFSRTADMRYAGQEHTVSVPVDFEPDDEGALRRLYGEFQRAYESVYGYTLQQPADVVNVRVKAIGEIPTPELREIETSDRISPAAVKGTRRVLDFVSGRWLDCRCYERSRLLASNVVPGPAVIEEPTTVTIVRDGQRCEVDRFGNLLIRRRREARDA